MDSMSIGEADRRRELPQRRPHRPYRATRRTDAVGVKDARGPAASPWRRRSPAPRSLPCSRAAGRIHAERTILGTRPRAGTSTKPRRRRRRLQISRFARTMTMVGRISGSPSRSSGAARGRCSGPLIDCTVAGCACRPRRGLPVASRHRVEDLRHSPPGSVPESHPRKVRARQLHRTWFDREARAVGQEA